MTSQLDCLVDWPWLLNLHLWGLVQLPAVIRDIDLGVWFMIPPGRLCCWSLTPRLHTVNWSWAFSNPLLETRSCSWSNELIWSFFSWLFTWVCDSIRGRVGSVGMGEASNPRLQMKYYFDWHKLRKMIHNTFLSDLVIQYKDSEIPIQIQCTCHIHFWEWNNYDYIRSVIRIPDHRWNITSTDISWWRWYMVL